MNDLLLQKLSSLQRCIKRVRQEFEPKEEFLTSLSRQDAAILNIQRACEVAIDIANKIIRAQDLGIPPSSRGSFDTLHAAGAITAVTCENMKRMVGFRNIAVHENQNLDVAIVVSVIENKLADFEQYAREVTVYST